MISRSQFAGFVAWGFLGISFCHADTYSDILDPDQFVTGVRGLDSSDLSDVLLTGDQAASDGSTQGILYEGNIAGGGTTYYLTPTFSGQTVTNSTFYGPDTPEFNPSIGAGNVQAVGSYQTVATGSVDHGMLYQGSANGVGGTWTNIDMSSSVAGGTVGNTIAHSTMGNLVVGNYDLAGQVNSANAYIYNISTGAYTAMTIGGSTTNDTTAYGIWQNGGPTSTSYTIVGGSQAGLDVNKAYLVNYDSVTGLFTDLTYYTFGDSTGSITHFEGITAVAGGYNLIGTTDTGAALAFIPVVDGTFGAATWDSIYVPGSDTTTGNSIYEDIGMGIYTTDVDGMTVVQSYIVVPEPSASGALMLSLLGMGLLYRFRRRSA